jgi:glutamine cyclotransferase
MGPAILGLAGVYAVATLLLVASQPCEINPGGPQLWGYDVVMDLPHDARAFTQGLQHDVVCDAQNSCSEVFWESTGAVGS